MQLEVDEAGAIQGKAHKLEGTGWGEEDPWVQLDNGLCMIQSAQHSRPIQLSLCADSDSLAQQPGTTLLVNLFLSCLSTFHL